MAAYYNENDPYAARWLCNLMAAGLIAPGHVDQRSIEEVTPDELKYFTQCHFFAGVGVWSLALRRAGWPDDRPVWTGSCPCQPFSSSGARGGFADERHLWPTWYWLIQQCGPTTLLGEQVASKDAGPWIDLVQTDVEAMDYAFGCVPFPSAGVGAPHIRDRAYWVANSDSPGLEGRFSVRERPDQLAFGPDRVVDRLADTGQQQRQREQNQRPAGLQSPCEPGLTQGGAVSRMAYTEHKQRPIAATGSNETARWNEEPAKSCSLCCGSGAGPTNGFWQDADWLHCRDGKWRPVESGTSPLADGAPARVGRLRAYGNAINVEAARVWIETVKEVLAFPVTPR